jgi:shikimate kinase
LSGKKPREKKKLDVPRSLVLVGLMGAGKTCIGRRLAKKLGLEFVDADQEIEAAAGCSIAEIFENHGEAYFRRGEQKVIKRLLSGPCQVISTGGGAFMIPETRKVIAERAISIWLKAELEVLHERTSRRNHRPLLRSSDPRQILAKLMDERYPVYAQADITVLSDESPADVTTRKTFEALSRYLASQDVPNAKDLSSPAETPERGNPLGAE